ncbi:DUF4961 domain-containing protein [Hymenobacter sp. PAMC 26628]|uniref:DUF4961 domain-containing protein n=1 Tax=Hymenobacter sp. PAMC 26628 TaxID=1484118 RepID=UPI0007701BA1|nr:alpha-amylase family glycosyl hydrolase [Hymenobacter sp. PAMC 26628]AMJ65762.1 1,4-alpha-glucan-branching protein [Hymenobacter sp. PAMC 26628]
MKILRLFGGLLLSLTVLATRAQVVTVQPTFFTADTPVTLTFDATQGNAGLAGFTGPVYIWTGAVTDKSVNQGDWKGGPRVNFNQPDPAALMTALGGDKYTITFTPRAFYGLAATDQLLKLAMLFRSGDGTKSGRATGGADIFVDAQVAALAVRITQPVPATAGNPQFVALNQQVAVAGTASAAATLTLYLNGTQVAQQANATALSATVTITQTGANVLRLTATDGGQTVEDTQTLVVRPAAPATAALPAGARPDGITYINGGASAILSLSAPGKQFVYVLGEFNNWQPTTAGFMNQTADNLSATPATVAATGRWWVQIDGLTPGQEYAYQFLVDGQLRVADPYCEKILDSNDDQYIPAATYPSLKAYPTGKTTGIVSVLQSNQAAYAWQTTNFQRPARTNLVTYELLVRDFVGAHNYQTLRDTLGYLQRLGVNAIELMPINEFDGNDNWGYSPDFYFAPDKYYGTKTALKQFIDECHRRGIAVVLDMVLNHSTGQSPMFQLYANGNNPAANNPWFNVTAPHPYSVYNDLNHESPYTRYFSKKVMQFWLQEYHVDGYRFDLAKGFTQKNSGTDVAAWGHYDQSRIDIWKDYYNTLVATDPTLYPILEHFADDDEETVLSNTGFMLWGNMNYSYTEATMGYVSTSDLSRGYYKTRGFNNPNLVTYMESHDEERLAFKNAAYGKASGTYSTKDFATSMARIGEAAAFFFTVPGPKLVWQFGEVGYDFTINRCPDGTVTNDCRTAGKPIRWDYENVAERRNLFNVYRSLIALKKTQPVFANPTAYDQQMTGATKLVHLSDANLSVTVVGNFDVVTQTVVPAFQSAGTWYNYLTGTSRAVTDVNAPLTLQPGEYAVYTSKPINSSTGTVLAARPQTTAAFRLAAFPSPAAGAATLHYELPAAAAVSLTICNVLGAAVATVPTAGRQAAGPHDLAVPTANLANGVYLVRLQAAGQQQTARLLVQH